MSLVKSWIVKYLCAEGSWRWKDSTGLRLDAPLDWYARHAQDVRDFGFLQARCVILKRELIELLVDVEAPEAVGVGELAEGAELFGAQGPLQFVGYFDQGHVRIIATREGSECGFARGNFTLSA